MTAKFCGDFKVSYQETNKLLQRPLIKFWVSVLIILICLFPFMASPYLVSIALFTLISTIGALGLNVLIGLTGQISIGHAAFMGIGAYTSVILYTKLGFPFLIGIICSGLMAALLGMIVGIPSIRLKGFYLAIATLAFQFVMEFVLIVWRNLTGGADGLVTTPPSLFGFEINTPIRYYFLCVAVAFLTTLFVLNIKRTNYGRIFMAIRDRDIAAEVLGINLFKYKLLSFAISSFYAGIAGSLFAHYVLLITPEQFNIWISIDYVAMIIIGGMGTAKGAILGAIFIGLLPEFIKALSVPLMHYFPHLVENLIFLREGIFGMIIIIFLIYEPEGIAKLWSRVRDFFKLWPYSY